MDSRAQKENQSESKNLLHFLEFELFNRDSKSHRNIGIVDVIPRIFGVDRQELGKNRDSQFGMIR